MAVLRDSLIEVGRRGVNLPFTLPPYPTRMHPFMFFINPPPELRRASGFVWARNHQDALRRVGHPDASVV